MVHESDCRPEEEREFILMCNAFEVIQRFRVPDLHAKTTACECFERPTLDIKWGSEYLERNNMP